MSIPDAPLIWMPGGDPRCTRFSEWSRGRIRTNDLSAQGYLTSLASTFISANAPRNLRPFMVTSAPFSTDGNGLGFPGCVWVVCSSYGQGFGAVPLRNPGVGGTATSSFTMSTYIGGIPVDVTYYATGCDPLATGTITIYDGTGTTVYGSITVLGSIGRNICYTKSAAFTSISNPSAPNYTIPLSFVIKSTWSGGAVPRYEAITVYESGFNAVYIAVPSTTPAGMGYVINPDTGTGLGGSLQKRFQADVRRAAIETNLHIGHYGLPSTPGGNCDSILGLPTFSAFNQAQSLWIAGALRTYSWMPIAIGTGVFSGGSATGGVVGIPPGETFFNSSGPGISSKGARGGVLTITFTQGNIGAGTLGPQVGDSAVITVLCDGSTIYTTTLSGTGIALSSPMVVSVPAMMPSGGIGSTCNIQVTMAVSGTIAVDGVGHQKLEQWFIAAALSCSPRCDIPFPFSMPCANDHLQVYQGAYLPSALGGSPANSVQGQTVIGSTVTVGSNNNYLVFIPPIAGWYRCQINGAAYVAGLTTSPFGYQDARLITRCPAGGSLYLLGLANQFYSLMPYVPTNVGILAGGTVVDLGSVASPHQGWAMVTPSAAGSWVISVAITDPSQMAYGLRIRTSLTDPSVLAYDQTIFWETIDELAGTTFISTQIATLPPITPSKTQAYIVGVGGTGAWLGQDGKLALWDDIQNQYQFITPQASPYTSMAYPFVWTGTAWVTVGNVVLTIPFVSTATPAPASMVTPIYLSLESFSTDRTSYGSPGRLTLSWAASP